MDIIILLAIAGAAVSGYLVSKVIGARRSAFVKAAGRKSLKALEILEEEGYHYLGGPGKKSVVQTINQKQYQRDVNYDLVIRRGVRRYLVLIAKSEKEKLHIVEMRERLMLLSESLPSDGLLHVTVSTGKIIPIAHRWTGHKDYRVFSRERAYRLFTFAAGILATILWYKTRGI